jgi:hypothetical protein
LNDYEVVCTITSDTTLVPDSLLLYYELASMWYEDTLTVTGGQDEYHGYIPAQSPGTIIRYYLYAQDAEGKADTTDTVTFRVVDYGVSLSPSFDSSTGAVDDTLWYDLTATNTGVYADDYTLSVVSSWPTSLWDVTGTVPVSSTGTLLSDETFDFKARVIIPASLYGDVDSAGVEARSTGNVAVFVTSVLQTTSLGEPLSIPFTDNFPTTTIDIGKWVLISGATSNDVGLSEPSTPYSANFDGDPGGADTIMSQAIDLKTESNVVVKYYYEQTGGGESPDAGDDLFVEYMDSVGTWQLLQQHVGADPDMTQYVQMELPLPGDAYHSGFRLRVRNTATSGAFDDWFVDDVYVGLPPSYQVLLSPSFAGQYGPAGDSAWYVLTVHNQGLFDDTYDLSDSVGVWDIAFFDATGMVPISSAGPVTAGDSLQITVKVAIPGGALINETDTSWVYAVSQNDPNAVSFAVLATTSAGAPGAFPWYEPFPYDSVPPERWLSNVGATVSLEGLNPPSSPYSMNVDGGVDTVVSQLIDLSGQSGAILSYYYERGGSGEAPDAGDDLWVEYKNSVGSWVPLSQQLGSGPVMTSFAQAMVGLPPDALHNSFQVRVHTFGSCVDCDDWYVDDIRIDFAPSISVLPMSFVKVLAPDDSTTDELVIANAGPGGLVYSVEVSSAVKSGSMAAYFADLLAAGEVAPSRRKYPEGFADVVVPKGADDPRAGFPVTKAAGGPDGFGYVWLDSDEPGGPSFAWEDVSGTGIDVVGGLNDDNYVGPFELGFAFPYYDTSYTQFYVGSNGIIGFDTTNMDERNETVLPSSAVPNAIVAWLWDDLNPDDADNPGAHVYYDTTGGRCVIQFVDYPEYLAAAGDVVNAEVILEANGTIKVQYLSMASGFDVLNCAVGIENETGTDGLEVAYHATYLHDSLAVLYVRPAQWLRLGSSSGSLAPGEADTIACTFTAADLDTGVYTANVAVSSNDPDSADNPWLVPAELTVSGDPVYTLALSPETLSFMAATGGGNPDSQMFAVSEVGGAPIVYTVSETAGWFSLNSSGGTTPDEVAVTVDISALAAGSYFDSVTVSSDTASNSPVRGYVDLLVFRCGDIDNNGDGPNIADLDYLVDFLFRSGPPPEVMVASDVNGSGGLPNIADLDYLVSYLFRNGPPPNCL